MVNPVQCNNSALPISIDLDITVTKAQTLNTIDLSTPVFVTPESPLAGPLPTGAGRIAYYDTLNSVTDVYGTLSESYKAATSFFGQSPRAETLAIAQIFTTPQVGYMLTGIVGGILTFIAVSDGEFSVTIDGVQADVTALDFTLDTDYDDVAATITAGLVAAGFVGATAVASAPTGTAVQFEIISGTIGDGSSVSVLSTILTPVGTDISGVANDFLNGQSGETFKGYTPTGLANELTLISEAATCSGKFVYAYVIDHVYSETTEQLNALAWAQGQEDAIIFADSNNPIALDAGDTTSNVLSAFSAEYDRTYFEYNSDYAYYKPMELAAYMLSIDYNAENSAATAKFKDYPGIPTTPITETQLTVLESKRGNVFTTIGNGARTVREGTTSSAIWYLDDRINIDNFKNDLLTEVYNVFLVNPKVPFTPPGQMKLYQAEQRVCNKYVRNGVCADRVVQDLTQPSGIRTIPAYVIDFAPLSTITTSDRLARVMTGNTITLQLSGAVHKLVINVIVQG